jgi:hypothetical protein
MIKHKNGDLIDIKIHSDEADTWIEGEIIMIDYENMVFFIRSGRFVFSRPFFSEKIAPVHTHTTPWRNFNVLNVGTRMEYRLESTVWTPAVIVFRDYTSFKIFIVYYKDDEDDAIGIESLCIQTSDRLALFPSYLSEHDTIDWTRLSIT